MNKLLSNLFFFPKTSFGQRGKNKPDGSGVKEREENSESQVD
jgi:hypothetical protein